MHEFFINLLAFFAALLLWGLVKHFFPGYFAEKGKNRATKEDLSEITVLSEEAKHPFAQSLESQKQFGHLRFAALEKRIEVAQQAYIHWWNLIHALHTPKIDEEVLKCQEFWVHNRLYLDEEAAFAFRRAYMAAGDHQFLKDGVREDPTQSLELTNNFKRITAAENAILQSVALPRLSEEISIAEELKKHA